MPGVSVHDIKDPIFGSVIGRYPLPDFSDSLSAYLRKLRVNYFAESKNPSQPTQDIVSEFSNLATQALKIKEGKEYYTNALQNFEDPEILKFKRPVLPTKPVNTYFTDGRRDTKKGKPTRSVVPKNKKKKNKKKKNKQTQKVK